MRLYLSSYRIGDRGGEGHAPHVDLALQGISAVDLDGRRYSDAPQLRADSDVIVRAGTRLAAEPRMRRIAG